MSGPSLRSRRLRLGWSKGQLAHALGVSETALAEWEEDSAKITCPHALEQLLEQREATSRRDEVGAWR
jgi:transcriptional regulator with XRE-family HTH domain